MGTRSLLAVEEKPDKLHVQYMQFDGYPQNKGKDFYHGVVRGLTQATGWFKRGKPVRTFFKRVRHFLDEFQYQSGHSINHNFKATLRMFLDMDSWQEWQYWFDRNGDFHIIKTGGEREVVIPWEITNALAETGYEADELLKGPRLNPFWKQVEAWLRGSEKAEDEAPPQPDLRVEEYGKEFKEYRICLGEDVVLDVEKGVGRRRKIAEYRVNCIENTCMVRIGTAKEAAAS